MVHTDIPDTKMTMIESSTQITGGFKLAQVAEMTVKLHVPKDSNKLQLLDV